MTEAETTVISVKRVLVALDASARGRAALEVAIQLAIATSAELQGLFVEDEDLVRLAALPFACEVDFTSASSRQLQSSGMERELRVAADEARRAFASALQQLSVNWTFRVVRGTITQASLAAAGDVDLLVIGQQGRSSLMMTGDPLGPRVGRGSHVVAVFDGSPSAYRMLKLAQRLAEPNDAALTVLVLADQGDQQSNACLTWLQQQGIRAEVNQLLRPIDNAIVDYVRKYSPSMLLINRDSGLVNDQQVRRIVDEFDCPLIIC